LLVVAVHISAVGKHISIGNPLLREERSEKPPPKGPAGVNKMCTFSNGVC